MIETDEQRRWWFATHPEFSWSHRGEKASRKLEKDDDKIDPAEVDAYVDKALKHLDGPVADLLRSVKRHFGTEANSNKPDRRLAYLDEAARESANDSSATEEDGGKKEPTFWDAVAKGIDSTLEDWQRWFGLGARLPAKGTPERRQIETARERGIKAKKAEELANIRAGGKGSGVWTEEELAEISRTGKFPIDARWHHDPTVANRPDLASDPRAVRPLRGGDSGHLRDGHQGNYRNPTE